MRGNRIVFAKQSQLKPVIKRHFSKGEFVKKLHFLGCWPTFPSFLQVLNLTMDMHWNALGWAGMWCMGCDMVLLYSWTNSFIYIYKSIYYIFPLFFTIFIPIPFKKRQEWKEFTVYRLPYDWYFVGGRGSEGFIVDIDGILWFGFCRRNQNNK